MSTNESTPNASYYFYEKRDVKGRFSDVRKILSSVQRGGRHPRVYLVTVSDKEDEIFEIIECNYSLKFLAFRDKVKVIGLIRGIENATDLVVELVSDMALDVYSLKEHWENQSYLPLGRMSL